jgi:uncharacterized protein
LEHLVDDWTNSELCAARDQLIETLRGFGRVAVAFSGGVDSAVVAQAAHLADSATSVAVTAVSASLAAGELEAAGELARHIGIAHRVIHTREFESAGYLRNEPDRCYYCKNELYGRLASLRAELGVDVIASGANLDDAGDHRPGLRAASEHEVRHPLIECGLDKAKVRALARAWNLPVWDKPASPCLSSRVAYGEEPTPERLRMIDQAESWVRSRGIPVARVRYHRGDLARVEVPLSDLPALLEPRVHRELVAKFRQLGFKFVTLDLEGFRSGSLNDLVPIERLERARPSQADKSVPTRA